ncbi:glutathionylspermidine synthase family protein [Bacillus bombysepticus]|uniref:glutathionylspermidine synthase family protein n=1 Tax=Bacillus bombysepticus TaxID=658666 RepID=UPI0030186066
MDLPIFGDKTQEGYALPDFYFMSLKEKEEIHTATKDVWDIFCKFNKLLRQADDELLLQLGFPKVLLPYLRMKSIEFESVIARIDWIYHEGSWKLIEINSDTPFLIKECFWANNVAATQTGMKSCNEGMDSHLSKVITEAIYEGLEELDLQDGNVIFSTNDEYIESWYTASYLRELSMYPSRLVPLQKLTITPGEALYDENGEKVDVLIRHTYPIEFLMDDIDKDSHEKIGLSLLELVQQRKLVIINPMSAFLMQNKANLVVIWGLMEQGEYFDEKEQEIIKKHFLPTYLEADKFEETNQSYVKKPCFGREGNTVTIYDDSQETSLNHDYNDFQYLYQKYAPMPKREFNTGNEFEEFSMLFGSFVVGDSPSAIGLRAGGKITQNNDHFVPIYIAPSSKSEKP